MKNYNVHTASYAAAPRSKRLRSAGLSSAAATKGSSGKSSTPGSSCNCDGHTHANKNVLDSLAELTDDNYLKTRRKVSGADDSVFEKVKAGFADSSDLSKKTQNDSFTSGMLGTGHRMITDLQSGESYAEVDHLRVRKTMEVYELVIQQLKHQGGIVFYTAAAIECTSVEDTSAGYKCYFDTKNGSVYNEFVANDQARCQRFNAQSLTAKYYWRLVTAVGEDYIILSKTDYDTGSAVPAAGDIIVQCGHRSDAARQSAKITRVVGEDTPRDEYYSGINGYNLVDKLVTVIGMKNGVVGVYTTQGDFQGKITAESGQISGFKIEQNQISTRTGSKKMILNKSFLDFKALDDNDDVYMQANIGTSACIAESAIDACARLQIDSTDNPELVGRAYALILSAKGGYYENVALYIGDGDVKMKNPNDSLHPYNGLFCEGGYKLLKCVTTIPETLEDGVIYCQVIPTT